MSIAQTIIENGQDSPLDQILAIYTPKYECNKRKARVIEFEDDSTLVVEGDSLSAFPSLTGAIQEINRKPDDFNGEFKLSSRQVILDYLNSENKKEVDDIVFHCQIQATDDPNYESVAQALAILQEEGMIFSDGIQFSNSYYDFAISHVQAIRTSRRALD